MDENCSCEETTKTLREREREKGGSQINEGNDVVKEKSVLV